jgi:hypothetical protein
MYYTYMMSTPLDDHGGPVPPSFHTCSLADKSNKVFLFVRSESESFNFMQLYESLKLNDVAGIFIMVPHMSDSLQRFHPLVHYFSSLVKTDEFVFNIIKENKMENIFYTTISEKSIIHPEFWKLLSCAKAGKNYTYLDETGREYTLWSMTCDGLSADVIQTDRIAAYATAVDEKEVPRIKDAAAHGLMRQLNHDVPELVVDTSTSYTPLCRLATKYMTDKSPYNVMTHCHPYTAVYDTFLRPFQSHEALKFGEVGVLNGASVKMWREYFPFAAIHGFDISTTCLSKLSDIHNVTGHLVDAGESTGLRDALQEACADGKKFDILLEDASHMLSHQLIFLREAVNYVRPGGLLIIEDIFRAIPAARFKEAIQQISDKVHNAVLIRPEHVHRFSPGWDNDRILLLWVK